MGLADWEPPGQQDVAWARFFSCTEWTFCCHQLPKRQNLPGQRICCGTLCLAMCQVNATLTCGVNACVSTYLCLCSHLCHPCRRISAEPVETDVTGLAVWSCWWTGLEMAAAAALHEDGRWHQLHPDVRPKLGPAIKMRAGVVEGGLRELSL